MPRYYFHIKNGDETIVDEEGAEYDNLVAVRTVARDSARQIMSDGVLSGEPLNGRVFVITDDSGRTVMEYPFQEAITNAGA